MSKRFFSLIFGDTVHIAPKTKVISADSFSKLIDAEDLLKHIKEDVEKYRLQIVEECEKIKEAAQKEGFESGFQKWAAHLAELEQEIIKVRKDTEKVIAPVALKAAKKIVGRELELNENTIVDIIFSILKSVAQHKKITIYVNRKDLEIMEANRSRLKEKFESLESLSIRSRDDVEPGGCIVETEMGIINAQLENQWRILEKAFDSLAKPKKEA